RICQVCHDKSGQIGKDLHGLQDWLVSHLVKVEQDRDVTVWVTTRRLSQSIKSWLAILWEAAKNQNDFAGDGIEDRTNLFVLQDQVEELSHLQVVHRDLKLTRRCNV